MTGPLARVGHGAAMPPARSRKAILKRRSAANLALSARILSALAAGPLTIAQLARALRKNPSSVAHVVLKMHEAGEVTRDGSGDGALWHAAPAKAALAPVLPSERVPTVERIESRGVVKVTRWWTESKRTVLVSVHKATPEAIAEAMRRVESMP